MDNGWIKLHRKILKKGWTSNPNYLSLWVHILLKANHKPKEFMWNNEIIVIKEGQFITGRKQLAKETGISETSIERILKLFENGHQIGQQKTNKFRLITVVNWKEYQEGGQQSGQQTDNKRTTDGQQTDTNKNDKNDKNLDILRISSEQGSQVNDLMKKFISINPSLKWQNRTERKACEEMIERFGYEKAEEMAELVVQVQGQEFAPRATTPTQMWRKIADFKYYFEGKNKSRLEVHDV